MNTHRFRFSHLCSLVAFSVLGLSHSFGSPPPGQGGSSTCGNGRTGGPTDPSTCHKPSPDGADPINITSGDFRRNLVDLPVWGSVGSSPLSFTRLSHTRTTAGQHYFGASNDRHNYQWEIADAGVNASGQAVLTIHYPAGASYNFAQVTPTTWSPPASCEETLTQSGNDFYLQRRGGTVYHFDKLQDSSNASFYRMEGFKDAAQNATTFTYDASVLTHLIKVTEPAGRSINISWGTQTISSATLLASINAVPPANAWSTITLPTPVNFTHVWYRSADNGYGNVAELQFLDSAGNVLSGTPFGSTPFYQNSDTASFNSAFDGNLSTFYDCTLQSGAVAGLNFGSQQQIASIRYYPRTSYESRMYASPGYNFDPGTPGQFWGSNDAPVTVDVIASVTSRDPMGNAIHTVTYTYGSFADQTLPNQNYVVLSSVNYQDGTQATFSYQQLYPGTQPLVASYNEPRYSQPLVRANLLYKTGKAAVLGAIWQQCNPDTHEAIVTWGSDPSNAHQGTLWFANGSTQSTQKDSSTGQLTATTDPKGATTQYQYSQSGTGYFSQQTDPAGRVTTYTRDANQNLLVETYPDGSKQTYTRDNFGLVLTSKDELNRTTTYTRDANHRVIATTYPDGTTESFTYNTFGQVLTNIRRDGTSTSNTYDSTGRKIASTDPLGKVTSYSYDAADRLASVTDALGHTTRYSYNLRGQVTQATYADTTTRSATYDLYGSLSSSTDELGHTSLNTYDWYKRILTHADALGRTTVYNYGIPGVGMGGGCGCSHIENFPTTITSPAGRVTYFTYDLKWQKTSETSGYGTPSASTTSYAYDVLDRIISKTDGLGHVWATTFDLRDRTLTETNPLNQMTGFTYDLAGNLLTTRLPDGRVTANTYDTVNRMVTTTDPKNQIMSYGYDAMDRRTTLTDTKSNITTWTYDARGGLTGKTYANGDHLAYTHDDLGRLTTQTTPKNEVCTYSYDLRNRLLSSIWNTAIPATSRTYLTNGLLKSIDNGNARSEYSYDVANELTSETQTLSGQAAKIVSYTYDPDGNRATTTYPSGKLVELAWTPRNQLASVTYAYDLGGRLSSISHENGIVENKTYDNANRLLSTIHSNSGSITGGDTYTLDSTGRRTAETFADGTTPARSYGYDPTNQVTAADYGAGKTDAYAYDPMGNRATATLAKDNGATTSYTTNLANQYTGISAQAAPTFDANGNLLSGNGVSYTWDSENRLLSYADATNRIDATYDALHRRLAKKVTNLATNTVTSNTQYVYDGWNVIEEINLTSNTLAKTLIWGNDISGSLQGAGGVGGLLQVSNLTAGISSHFHYDGNGNVTQLTDDSGVLTASYRYDAFGNTLVASGPAAALNNYRFSTKPIDGEVGNAPLYYYGYRYYDPLTGRWPSRDPIEELGGINLYGFVGNDSVGGGDILGLDSTNWGHTHGRGWTDGPRNGNWGGKNWSGGKGPADPPGPDAPPTDSADEAYKNHDKCYDACPSCPPAAKEACMKKCDADLKKELSKLPKDSKKWPHPPKPGTEGDSERFRKMAELYF